VATSLTDFWRRWHITLSTWLRDYLYIPLGGNRRSPPRVYLNLLITMGLGGLWHGASVTFVIWGLYHGALLAVERWLGLRPDAGRRRGPLAWVATFACVQFGWLIFRAGDLDTLEILLGRAWLFPIDSYAPLGSLSYLPLVLAFYVLHAGAARLHRSEWLPSVLVRGPIAASALAAAIVAAVVFGGASDAFIYFQF